MNEKCYWIAFNKVKGIGAVRIRGLLDYFGDLTTAWQAAPHDLVSSGLSAKIVERLIAVRATLDLEDIWKKIDTHSVEVLTWNDREYPRRLKDISQPPPVLYVSGELKSEDDLAVAVVGTRQITPYGRQVTERLAAVLARHGVTVVSGLARGVDAAAHRAALKAGGRTIAVLGSGVDRIYPPEHKKLAEQITHNGAVVSDYALETPPDSTNFPPRNRIISGLSAAVVVVESGKTGGALITAEFAAEQGRDVFAVPGSILAPLSIGPNRLIQQGAFPLLDPNDLLDMLEINTLSKQRAVRSVLPADAVEARLYEVLSSEPLHIDDIRNQVELPIEKVSAALALMELKGLARQVGGMNYVREVEPDYIV
ncbi:MAG: DNA-processing protein DprA [Anaerolineales bacterium]|nr:DNA-processing protein DprA [Anaerolineales bacterium]